MKKNVILAAVILFSSMMFAAPQPEKTVVFGVVLSSSFPEEEPVYGGIPSEDVLTFVEAKNVPEALLPMLSSSKNINNDGPWSINVYSLSNKTSLGMQSTYGTDNLVTVPIGIMTNCGINGTTSSYSYKLTVSDANDNAPYTVVEGHTPMYLYDLYEGVRVPIAKGNYLSFDADTCATINDRFLLVVGDYFTPEEGDLEVCHQNGKLEVRTNPFATDIVIKDEANQVVKTFTPMPSPFFYPLESLSAGRYTVEFNGGEKKYIIAVNPTLTETETPVP